MTNWMCGMRERKETGVTPGDRLGQMVMRLTELLRSGGEQTGRENKEFQFKDTDFVSCPGGSYGVLWA